jgi:hypothetical protein
MIRKYPRLWLRLAALVFLWCQSPATILQTAFAETVKSTVDTVAGPLAITQLDEWELGRHFKVSLAGKTILETGKGHESENFPFPEIIGRFTAQAKPYDDLFLLQQFDWGTACNGGPLWFLGINRDGSFKRFDSMDFCGGKPPVIKAAKGTVELRIPGDVREIWTLTNGVLTKRK